MIKNIISYSILFILIILFVYGFFNRDRNLKDLKNNGCYTIAHTMGKRFQWKRGWVVDYEYSFNNTKYKSYDNIGSHKVNVNGGYYLVRISVGNPQFNKIYFDWTITDTAYIYAFTPLCDDK